MNTSTKDQLQRSKQQTEVLLENTYQAFLRESLRFKENNVQVFKLSRRNPLHSDLFLSALIFTHEVEVAVNMTEVHYTTLLIDGTHDFMVGAGVGSDFQMSWSLSSIYDDHYRYNIEKLLVYHMPKAFGVIKEARLPRAGVMSRSLGVGVLPIGFDINSLLVTTYVAEVMISPFAMEIPPIDQCRHLQNANIPNLFPLKMSLDEYGEKPVLRYNALPTGKEVVLNIPEVSTRMIPGMDRVTLPTDDYFKVLPLQEFEVRKPLLAMKIGSVILIDQSSDGYVAVLQPADPRHERVHVGHDYMEKCKPKVGGYYVVDHSGYMFYLPGQLFETLFYPANPIKLPTTA